MRRKIIISLVIVLALVVFGGIIAFKTFLLPGIIQKAIAGMPAPVQTVSTTTAGAQTWQPQLQAVGSLRAAAGADLSVETAGIIDEIDFKSGDEVQMGATLLHLRDADDVAKTQSLAAAADLAKVVATRDQKQLSAQAVSQATVDTDLANLKNAQAQLAEQQAVVDKKTLKAPFAGRLGIRTVDVGQYLNAGTTIVTLQNLDQLYLDFVLPQQALAQIKVGQKMTVKVDTYPDQTSAAVITAIEPRVDATSRNVSVRATLDNPGHKLLPGMFATAAIDTGAPQQLVTLPQTAIVYNSFGNAVYILQSQGKDDLGKDKLTARQNFVTLGATRGDQIAILTGVKPGDVVVTTGQLKLRNGAAVQVDNSIQPSDDAHPIVKDP